MERGRAVDTTSIAILSFAGVSVVAAGITAFVKHCVSQPVISVCLDKSKG
jgi:hypothetical protein